MDQTQYDAIGFFFRVWPDSWDDDVQILDALADKSDRVELWDCFKDMHACDVVDAYNSLLYLLERTRKRNATF